MSFNHPPPPSKSQSKASLNLLPTLLPLSPTTSLYQPPTFTPTSPTILLLTWLNATPRHITFYLQHYISLFPTARIILSRGTVPNMVYIPQLSQIRALGPAITVLKTEPESPIMMHLFSNAGAQQAGLFLRAWKTETGSRMKVRSLICDSSVSIGEFSRGYTGISFEVPRSNPVIHYLGLRVVYFLVLAYWVFEKVTGQMNVLAQANLDLRDEALMEIRNKGSNERARRWYLYSKEDQLVRWDDVEWHADQVEAMGGTVERVVFEGSGHCRHGKEYEEIYWEVVKRAVEFAVAADNGGGEGVKK